MRVNLNFRNPLHVILTVGVIIGAIALFTGLAEYSAMHPPQYENLPGKDGPGTVYTEALMQCSRQTGVPPTINTNLDGRVKLVECLSKKHALR